MTEYEAQRRRWTSYKAVNHRLALGDGTYRSGGGRRHQQSAPYLPPWYGSGLYPFLSSPLASTPLTNVARRDLSDWNHSMDDYR
jgi:hypothetical protein